MKVLWIFYHTPTREEINAFKQDCADKKLQIEFYPPDAISDVKQLIKEGCDCAVFACDSSLIKEFIGDLHRRKFGRLPPYFT
jgi:hypothetical protein